MSTCFFCNQNSITTCPLFDCKRQICADHISHHVGRNGVIFSHIKTSAVQPICQNCEEMMQNMNKMNTIMMSLIDDQKSKENWVEEIDKVKNQFIENEKQLQDYYKRKYETFEQKVLQHYEGQYQEKLTELEEKVLENFGQIDKPLPHGETSKTLPHGETSKTLKKKTKKLDVWKRMSAGKPGTM